MLLFVSVILFYWMFFFNTRFYFSDTFVYSTKVGIFFTFLHKKMVWWLGSFNWFWTQI